MLYTIFAIVFIIPALAVDLVVDIANGKIEGHLRNSPNKIAFRAFQGIPFAKPPLGDLRFQAPVPAENWTGILETKKDGYRCFTVAKDTDDENEDCLYINVYTPILTQANTTLLPVMAYIYGGGFTTGASNYNFYGPDYLIEQDVIVVTSNYRVGPFGFLSTADEIIPGNTGLKDQLLALKWVQRNIRMFGGDPSKVIVFGQSAGAASVGLHILSKQSAGLFRGGISESGSGISNWAYLPDPTPYGYELASLIDKNINITTSSELLKYLQSVPAKAIDIASTKTTIITKPRPVIEVEHDGAFLTKNLYESLKNGEINRVPLLIGANSEEDISLALDMESLKSRAAAYDQNLKKLVLQNMNIVNDSKLQELGQIIKGFYLSSNESFQDNLGLAVAYNSETQFFNPCVRHADLQSQYTDVYLYKFSYAGVMGKNNNITLPGAEKVAHVEEMNYIFKINADGYDNSDLTQFPENDVTTHNRMIKLWTNFAKYLNPTPEADSLLENIVWPKVDPSNIHYMNIDTHLTVESNIKHGRYILWRDLFEKEAISPVVF
ncbi:juvenile hormone esterase-like [Diorhabda sublineata]|uniref:juvenile hormone esterase-like n=1 Tax=Diorhabda sublineata TaxID=1163346 RepID=UPI0024E0F8D2|nr:juvenile hormone esterase-like [Diorhabda sublineata]